MSFYYIAALKKQGGIFMRAYLKVSRRALGKTTEYCKCDLSRSGKRTQIKKEDGTGDGSQNKQKNNGICFPVPLAITRNEQKNEQNKNPVPDFLMGFFSSAIDGLKTVITAIEAGIGVWGVINLLEGYGNDNAGSKSQGIKQLMAGGGIIILAQTVIPLLSSLFGGGEGGGD